MSAPEPRSPLDGVMVAGSYGATSEQPVRIATRRAAAVEIAARKGHAGTVASAVAGSFGLTLPQPGRAAYGGHVSAFCIQPDTWLVLGSQSAEGAFARMAKAACGDRAAIVDQTHGRAILSLSGAAARDVLARLCRVDLHPASFSVGSAAPMQVAALPCLLHLADAEPSFDLVAPSTLARHFLFRLTRAAEPFGYVFA